MSKFTQRLWSSGTYYWEPIPDLPTAFELKVQRLGLADQPETWPYSKRLRAWVKANKNSRYIPEDLIRDMGLSGFHEYE